LFNLFSQFQSKAGLQSWTSCYDELSKSIVLRPRILHRGTRLQWLLDMERVVVFVVIDGFVCREKHEMIVVRWLNRHLARGRRKIVHTLFGLLMKVSFVFFILHYVIMIVILNICAYN